MEHKDYHTPPRHILRFFRWYCHPGYLEDIEGDLWERFGRNIREKGLRAANWFFLWDVIILFRPGIIRLLKGNQKLNYFDMFKHNLKIGYRNLLRKKGYSLINIGGLTAGMAVAMLIGLWLYDELTFNQYHQNYDRIAQVMQVQTINGRKFAQTSIPMPLGSELRDKYGSDFKFLVMSSWFGDHILSNNEKKLSKMGGFMDVDAPHLLSLKMLQGTMYGLKEPGSILLSSSVAKALFGKSNPIDKVIQIDNYLTVKVTGIYEDLPYNSRFRKLMFIAPWELYVSSDDWLKEARDNPNWNNNSFQLIAQVTDHADMRQVSGKIKRIKYDNQDESSRKSNAEIFLHPMKDWHLRSNWENGVKTGGLIQYVWLFGIVGVFVLLLACINFMNLSTAHSAKRSKEVGIRKSVGSVRSQLIGQFLSESFLVVFLAFVLAILLVFTVIHPFNQLAGKQMVFPFTNLHFWLISLGFVSVTGFLAGSYPALYLSSFHPVKVLKGTFKVGRSAASLRKVLVVLQFTVSVTLIIGTIMVEKQILYSKNRPVGYDQNGIIMIEMNSPDHYGKYELLRNELKKNNTIVEMAQSSSPLTGVWNENDGYSWEGKDADFLPLFATIQTTFEFGKTVGWEIINGRDFSSDFASDSAAFIVNESAVRYMGLEDPVGKIVKFGSKDYEIIGVVKDLLMESPFKLAKQTVYLIDQHENVNWMVLKLNPDKSTAASLAMVKDVFNQYIPAVPFEYVFADEDYARKFASIERIGKLSETFAILAIFISCLGLFGLASFMAEQRIKEIGIRKVLGASVLNLWQMLSREFVALVVLSSIIAIPISYYAVTGWLQNYEYRTDLSWWVFGCAVMGGLIITLLTVSLQSVKAAMVNPVNSLKSE